MHIAYLTPEYPHPRLSNSGGMGTSIKNLVTAIINEGHQVTVFVYGQREDTTFIEHKINFHAIKTKDYSIGGFYLYRKHIERFINSHINGIDIIEAPDWTGITAFMNLKKPLIIRFHGSDTYFCHIEGRKQKWKNALFEKLAVRKSLGFIAPTRYAGEVSMGLFNQPLEKLRVIHYGLELENFCNEDPTIYKQHSLLNIGTLIRKKGVFQLVEMFNEIVVKYPDAQLYFIGSDSTDILTGSTSTWSLMQNKMTVASKPNIHYLGKVAYEEVQEQIKKSHVCVFPSLAETLGMVTIESMALQKAVVNTDMGWAQDLIDQGLNGFMYHPNNIDDYVNEVINLFKDKELVDRIGKNARKKVEDCFDINKNVLDNLDFYNTVLSW